MPYDFNRPPNALRGFVSISRASYLFSCTPWSTHSATDMSVASTLNVTAYLLSWSLSWIRFMAPAGFFPGQRISLINMPFIPVAPSMPLSGTGSSIYYHPASIQPRLRNDNCIRFLWSFRTVRHSALFDKFAHLEIPDNVYNWLVEFFQGHSHCTRYGHRTSALFRQVLSRALRLAPHPTLLMIMT